MIGKSLIAVIIAQTAGRWKVRHRLVDVESLVQGGAVERNVVQAVLRAASSRGDYFRIRNSRRDGDRLRLTAVICPGGRGYIL